MVANWIIRRPLPSADWTGLKRLLKLQPTSGGAEIKAAGAARSGWGGRAFAAAG